MGREQLTVEDSKFGTSTIESIAYGGNWFVAGGDDGIMAYSSDGVTWTRVVDSPHGTRIRAIAWSSAGNRFYSGSDNGIMAYSTGQ